MKRIILRIDHLLFSRIVRLIYPKYKRRYGYKLNIRLILQYAILQKLIGFNRFVSWPVHFTSTVLCADRIEKGDNCDPGDSPANYIQAFNGVKFGSTIELGPGVKIISANHDTSDFLESKKERSIEIGSNTWIGANSVIMPGVHIGKHVVIGAGSIVTKDIPSNSVAVGNPCRVIRKLD